MRRENLSTVVDLVAGMQFFRQPHSSADPRSGERDSRGARSMDRPAHRSDHAQVSYRRAVGRAAFFTRKQDHRRLASSFILPARASPHEAYLRQYGRHSTCRTRGCRRVSHVYLHNRLGAPYGGLSETAGGVDPGRSAQAEDRNLGLAVGFRPILARFGAPSGHSGGTESKL